MDLKVANPLSPSLMYLIEHPGHTAKITVYDSSGRVIGDEIFTSEMVLSLSTTPIIMEEARLYRLRKLNDIFRLKNTGENKRYLRSAIIQCVHNEVPIPSYLLDAYTSTAVVPPFQPNSVIGSQ